MNNGRPSEATPADPAGEAAVTPPRRSAATRVSGTRPGTSPPPTRQQPSLAIPNGDERGGAGGGLRVGGLAGWQVRALHRRAQGDIRGLTPSVLASEARLSVHHFSRAFRRSLGLPPGRWLTQIRVARARVLLTTTDMGIGAIARDVGYRGAPQLARAFRGQVGVTPLAFRRR